MTTPNLPTGRDRRQEAKDRRAEAADQSGHLPILNATDNGDEAKYPHGQPASFTKGLPHDDEGLVDKATYAKFRNALVTGDVAMAGLTIAAAPNNRKWESPLAGVYFNDIGADPDAVAMAPAPKLGASELCAEMASVYAMALTRDIPFEALENPKQEIEGIKKDGQTVTVGHLVEELRSLSWFDTNGEPFGFFGKKLTKHEHRRRKAAWASSELGLTIGTLFRGSTPGAKQGPYISQFMLLGTQNQSGVGNSGGDPRDGHISYGLQKTSQAQFYPEPGTDFMTTWQKWLTVQQGTKFDQPAHLGFRRIHTPRDLAGYVHFDALYQAYLNACLILVGNGLAPDPGTPILSQRNSNSEGFATWGPPHILSLVTEVATRSLRAARRTKFQVHRRARPEVIAARLTQVANGHASGMDDGAVKQLESMLRELGFNTKSGTLRKGSILDWIRQHNAEQNSTAEDLGPIHPDKNFLLPMAFIEGSPMHPAYGAGHATVAGACVTVLKAFFDSDAKFLEAVKGATEFFAADAYDELIPANTQGSAETTVSQELDKLAANISIGRNIAGVHYYSDYYDSLRMGERIAISILKEQMSTYHEGLGLSLKSFDGDSIMLMTDGRNTWAEITDTSGNAVDEHDWWVRDLAEYGIVDDGPSEPEES